MGYGGRGTGDAVEVEGSGRELANICSSLAFGRGTLVLTNYRMRRCEQSEGFRASRGQSVLVRHQVTSAGENFVEKIINQAPDKPV